MDASLIFLAVFVFLHQTFEAQAKFNSKNFVVNDVIAIASDTRRERDQTLNDQVQPLWAKALGVSTKVVQLHVLKDQVYEEAPATAQGKPIRAISYKIQAVVPDWVSAEEALAKFRQLAKVGSRRIYAVSSKDNEFVNVSRRAAA